MPTRKGSKQKAPMSLRLSTELNTRLEECARSLKVKKHALAQDAIEAAVEAIEKNGFRLVIPIRFEVSHVPTLNRDDKDPSSAKGDTEHILQGALDKDLKSSSGDPPKGKP